MDGSKSENPTIQKQISSCRSSSYEIQRTRKRKEGIVTAVENLGNNTKKRGEKRQYSVRFIRHGHRAHVEIIEVVEAVDAEEALNIAFELAEKAKWHVEKVERII